jgi:hypothetical protein
MQGGWRVVVTVRDVTSEDLHLFGEIVARLERDDLRGAILDELMRLMRADFGASHIWRADDASFQNSIGYNMDPKNLKNHDVAPQAP